MRRRATHISASYCSTPLPTPVPATGRAGRPAAGTRRATCKIRAFSSSCRSQTFSCRLSAHLAPTLSNMAKTTTVRRPLPLVCPRDHATVPSRQPVRLRSVLASGTLLDRPPPFARPRAPRRHICRLISTRNGANHVCEPPKYRPYSAHKTVSPLLSISTHPIHDTTAVGTVQ